jgi:hypothetical protein
MFEKVLNTDPYLDKLAELKPDLYHELLLAFIKSPQTKEAIIRHDATPEDILRLIAGEKLPHDLNFILQHPNCPPELIELKLKEGNDDDLLQISKNCSINEDQIRELAKSPHSPVLVWVSRRPDCPPDVLESAYLICEKQYEQAAARIEEEKVREEEIDNSEDDVLLIDLDSIFDTLDASDYFEVDDFLLLAIAANPNTPQHVFKKMLKMDLNLKDSNNNVLGVVLLQNPSVSDEDKVFLSLTGFIKSEKDSSQDYSLNQIYGLPTSLLFSLSKVPHHLKQALADVGQPMAVLDLDIELNNQEYDFNAIVEDWIKQETIYRTLWPELSERKDVSFAYIRSSYDGDNFYFSCKGVEFEHDFQRGAYTYNSMTYPSIDRPWFEISEIMDIEMSNENFSYRDVEEMFEYDSDEGDCDLVLATIISKNSWSHELPLPQYTLTKKGEDFVCEWAERFFEDDRDMNVIIHPDKALPYSWKALPIERKERITAVIVNGYKAKVDTKYQYAEHFLACIALNPHTPESIKNSLKEVESKVIAQALAVS